MNIRILFSLILLLTLSITSAQLSDDCLTAPILTPGQLDCANTGNAVTGTTVGATEEALGFSCIDASNPANAGVWARFTAQGPDIEILNNVGGPNQPYVVIIEDDCATAVEVICQQLPLLQLDGETGDDILTTGTNYLIWIGYQGTQNPIDVCITNGVAPANDDCANAIDISGSLNCTAAGGASISGSTEHAGLDGLDFPCLNAFTDGEAGVWYTFTTQGVDIVIEDGLGNSPYVVIADGCVDGSIALVCGPAPIDLTNGGDNILDENTQYFMWVGFENQAEQDFELCIDNPERPDNDDCATPQLITFNTEDPGCVASGVTLSEDLYGADVEGFGFACLPGSVDFEGVWYEFEAQGHDLYVESFGPNDPYVVITDGCDPGTAATVFCGQVPIDPGTTNESSGLPTNNLFDVGDIGQTFYMWVGFADGADEEFEICMDNPAPPDNDQCADTENEELTEDQLTCSVSGTTIVGTTAHSSWYFAAPDAVPDDALAAAPFPCIDLSTAEVVWYEFEALGPDISISQSAGEPLNFALIKLAECGGTFFPEFDVTCGTLPYDFLVDPDDRLETGENYYLLFANESWETSDSFEICIDNPPAPPNDLCENAIQLNTNELLGCANGGQSIVGSTINSSQEGLFWTNFDPLVDLDCMLDSLEDNGVWYLFTAEGTNLYVEDIAGNNPTIMLMNFNQCVDTASVLVCEQAPFLGEPNEPGYLNTNPGDRYLMYVTFQGGEPENDSFEICIQSSGNCDAAMQPPQYWCDATESNGFLFCELAQLDGFCFRNSNGAYNPPGGASHGWPGCNTNSVENPNWFTFYAGADNIQLEIFVGSCGGGGIQIMMYELDCTFPVGSGEPCLMTDLPNSAAVSDCINIQNAVNTGSILFSPDEIEFGNFYGIIVDGLSGDVCNMQIEVRVGGEPPNFDGVLLEDPEFDTSLFPYEQDTVCAGATDVPFGISEIDGACRYEWTINGAPVPGTDNDTLEVISFPDPGEFEICVVAGNTCALTEPACVTVVVAQLIPETLIDTICEGDTYEWFGPFGNSLPLDIDPATQPGGSTLAYEANTMNAVGCQVETFLELYILNENEDNPTVIDTVVCAPIMLLGQLIDPDNQFNNIISGENVSIVGAHGEYMCDSFFELNVVELELVEPVLLYNGNVPPLETQNITCQDSVIVVCPEFTGTIYPDPDVTPNMEVDYIWIQAFTNDTVGLEECLEITPEDFENPTNQRFDYYIILRYDGRPAEGCVHGPYEVRLDIREFMPDSVDILGPDTVCVGPNYTYTLELQNPGVDEFRDADSYVWDLSGMPGATRTEISEDSSSITFAQVGVGRICVTAEHFCINSMTVCKTIVVAPDPPLDAGADTEECSDEHQLSASPERGTWTVVNAPTGSGQVAFSDDTDPNATVTIMGKGVYTFAWNVDWYGCVVSDEINVDFVQIIELVGEIEYQCNESTAEDFTASFTFTGGVAPYTLTQGSGTLDSDARTFTSDPIPAGDSMYVLITDADGCTAEYWLVQACECLTEGGEMFVNNPLTLCGEVCVDIVNSLDPVPDDNDIVRYVLHTSSLDTIGTVIDENSTGTFCLTAGGPIQYGVQYYVSVVVGNDLAGTVDLEDRCTQVAQGQPLLWLEQPSPSSAGDLATCGQSVQLNVLNNNFNGQWIIVTPGPNITFDDQSRPDATISTMSFGTVQLAWVESNGICVDSAFTTVEFYQNPTAGAPRPGCNDDFTELSFTIALSGEGPFTESTGLGTFNGNEYEVTGLPAPYPGGDVLTFIDANGCELVVPLPIADCNCIPIVEPDTACGLSITLTSSGTGNSGFWTEATHTTGTGTVNISSPDTRMTDIEVSEFGIYCFEWTEEGSLCTLSTVVCIPFVDAPTVDPSTVSFACDDIYENYTVSFDIANGHQPTYQVTDELGNPAGSIIGSTFTSNSLASTQNVTFLIFDGFMCDTFVLDTTHDCGCITQVGDLTTDPVYLCIDDETAVVYDDINEVRDGNDVLEYLLYTDASDPYGSIIDQDINGVFAFDPNTMTLGTTYYVAALLADGIAGVIDINDNCRSLSMAIPVQWFDVTAASVTSSLPEFTCTDTEMTLTVSGQGIPDEYSVVWTTTNGEIQANDENSVTPTILSPGTYTVTVSHNLAGCQSTAEITIGESDDIPVIVINPPDLLTCAREQVIISADGSATGANITYDWSGPGLVQPTDQINVTVDQPGTYTLTLTDTDNGCVTDRQIIVGEDVQDPVAVATVDQLFDCNTDELVISGAGSSTGPNIRYAWSIIDGGSIVGGSDGQDLTIDASGTYLLEVTNTENGCVSTVQVVAQDDPTVISGVEVDLVQVTCDGDGADGQISIASVDGGTPPFMYSFDAGMTFQDASVLSELGPGEYPLIIMDANGCELEDTAVLTRPEPFTLDLGETVVVELGDSVMLSAITDLPEDQIQSVLWSPIYDSAQANTLQQGFLPDLGQYQASLTVNSINGCTEQATVLIVVKFGERIYIPTAMNPNSINPDNQVINIYADPASVAEISYFGIYDRWGERVFERRDIPPSLTLQPEYTWDGLWQDEEAHPGVYAYYVEVEFITGVKKTIMGDFTLLR